MSTAKENENAIPNILSIFKNRNLLVVAITIILSVMAYYIGTLTTELKFYRLGGVPAAQQGANTAPSAAAAQPQAPPDLDKPNDSDHKRGSITPKIALIEYSDLDCPYCATFHVTAKQALEDNPDLVWIYRHFPLSIHPNAFDKSLASECVFKLSDEDTFWKFADILFERKPELAELADIVSSDLGISGEQFTSCMDTKDTESRVRADMSSATKAGVNGTPGNFLVNLETGEIVIIPGAQSIDYVNNAIKQLL